MIFPGPKLEHISRLNRVQPPWIVMDGSWATVVPAAASNALPRPSTAAGAGSSKVEPSAEDGTILLSQMMPNANFLQNGI